MLHIIPGSFGAKLGADDGISVGGGKLFWKKLATKIDLNPQPSSSHTISVRPFPGTFPSLMATCSTRPPVASSTRIHTKSSTRFNPNPASMARWFGTTQTDSSPPARPKKARCISVSSKPALSHQYPSGPNVSRALSSFWIGSTVVSTLNPFVRSYVTVINVSDPSTIPVGSPFV